MYKRKTAPTTSADDRSDNMHCFIFEKDDHAEPRTCASMHPTATCALSMATLIERSPAVHGVAWRFVSLRLYMYQK